ncbi:hypothetical protein L288_09650 [Sphingobium quisquiliarum P25]|uniref:Uncharacterized protein n=1 Tax=Sphingobium quisquiliarum P25 TaxID=1329909 RepID=T0I6S1_9SPHN|nr:hypothetical protein L288_09650 [Sphingobium quisquiliarum P25]
MGQRIISPAGKIVIHVHDTNVDRPIQSVNKALTPFIESGSAIMLGGGPGWRLKTDFPER